MTSHVIGYFCEAGWTTANDYHFNEISSSIADTTTVLSYQGSQTLSSGLFAYGAEELADHFIADLKARDFFVAGKIQLNLIAHSRGVISALIAIKKIQNDPDLKDKIQITVDFHDPVPGNFQLTTNVAGNWAITNQVYNFSDCELIKKAHITLQEKPLSPIAFDALIPKFHPRTKVEIETLPGHHDVQHRNSFHPHYEHKALFDVGLYKSLDILIQDGHQLIQTDELIENQINAYNELVPWIREREVAFAQRTLHFRGKIIANNPARTEINAVNWRHANLLKAAPEHVLYGTAQSHYNYRKSLTERYCDLALTLDLFLERHPHKENLVIGLRQLAQAYCHEPNSRENFRIQCQNLLTQASVRSKSLNKALNAVSLEFLFMEIDEAISDNVPPQTLFYNNLQHLRDTLIQELFSEIESGKSIGGIDNSYPVKVAKNTAIFVRSLYPEQGGSTASEIIRLAGQYALDNIRFGKNWSLGQKIIATALVSLVAAIIGCVIGAIIGAALGLAIAPFVGPGALIPAAVGAFIGILKGAMIATATVGAIVGFGTGIIGSYYFFKPSVLERKIETLADDLKNSVEGLNDDPRQELLLN